MVEPGGQDAAKTRTSLLLDPAGNFLQFGSKAREDYYDTSALGLKWEEIGSQKPTTDTEVKNDTLASALKGKVEFTEEEWDTFNVSNFSGDSYIKAGDSYFKPAAGGMLFETFKMSLNDRHDGAVPLAHAINGQSQSLLEVITHSLKYVKDEAMTEINRSQVDPVGEHEIKWIVTGQFFSQTAHLSALAASIDPSWPSLQPPPLHCALPNTANLAMLWSKP